MALLLVVGLAVADVVTYSSLRSFLYGRLDAQIDSSQALAARYLSLSAQVHRVPTADRIDDRVSPDVYVLVLGRRVSPRVAALGVAGPSRPDAGGSPVRASADHPAAPHLREAPRRLPPQPRRLRPERAAGIGHAVPGPGAASAPGHVDHGDLPQPDRGHALARCSESSSWCPSAVLLLLCGLALWTVRRGLRPLDDMTRTADAIGSGDLTRRVGPVDDRTEVGRLGIALNAMLVPDRGRPSRRSRRPRPGCASSWRDASHELRTPLTSIRGYAELLRKGAVRRRRGPAPGAGPGGEEAARMGGLVDDLLLLARLDQGRPARGRTGGPAPHRA